MKKYLTLFRTSWQLALTYRASFLMFFVVSVIQTVFLLYLWFAIYDQGGKIGDYTFQEILTYYLLQFILNGVVSTFISWDIITDIKEGRFSNYFLKPIDYFRWQATINYASKIVEILFITIGVGIASFFLFRSYVLAPVSGIMLFHVIALTLLATMLSFILEFLIGMAAFWITEAYSFKFLTMTITRFFAGNILPLSLLPAPLITVSQFLPFPYLSYIPVQIYLGRVTDIGGAYMGIVFWIIFLYFITRLVYRLGIKKYEAVGS